MSGALALPWRVSLSNTSCIHSKTRNFGVKTSRGSRNRPGPCQMEAGSSPNMFVVCLEPFTILHHASKYSIYGQTACCTRGSPRHRPKTFSPTIACARRRRALSWPHARPHGTAPCTVALSASRRVRPYLWLALAMSRRRETSDAPAKKKRRKVTAVTVGAPVAALAAKAE